MCGSSVKNVLHHAQGLSLIILIYIIFFVALNRKMRDTSHRIWGACYAPKHNKHCYESKRLRMTPFWEWVAAAILTKIFIVLDDVIYYYSYN